MMRKQEAAKYLGVGVSTLERYMRQGRIPYQYEAGRTGNIVVFDEGELQTFRATRLREAAAQGAARTAAKDEHPSISFRLEPYYHQRLERLARQRDLSVHAAARWLVVMAIDGLQTDVIEGQFLRLGDRLEELQVAVARGLATLMLNLPEPADDERLRSPQEARAVIERAMGVSLG